jgi:hypothetical protein
MALSVNGTNPIRVMANGVYMRTVISNGVTVFNLNQNWSYQGLSFGTVDVTQTGFTYSSSSTATGFTLCNQQTNNAANAGMIFMTQNFPVQNYGGGRYSQIINWEVRNRFNQTARCYIDYGYPPLRYRVTGTY